MPKNKTLYGLPENIQFCKKCVISNQRPITLVETKHRKEAKKETTAFDLNEVCDPCNWASIKREKINWEERERELKELLNKHRSNDGSYDVVVPASGGKDSIYVAHILKYKYKMNPLTVTWAPHIRTEMGQINFDNMIGSGLDNVMATPNSKLHRKLTKLAFLNLGHPFQPFIIGQRVIGPRVAAEKNIKLIFYGENVAEYGNRIKDNYFPLMDNKLISAFDVNNEELFISGVKIKDLKKQLDISSNELEIYKSPSEKEIIEKKIEVHYMSYYRFWSQQENFYYASENSNFQTADERTPGTYTKSNGLDDKLESFHYYMMMIKFGMGRATWDAAQEVRDNKITREEGVTLVNKYDTEFPEKYFQDFLDYISINKDTFFKTVDEYRSEHLWEKQSNNWKLRKPVS
jgi:N-acetyl sugar amidotransferase